MNYKKVLSILGKVIVIEGILLLFPLIVAFIYKEVAWTSILISSLICLVVGLFLALIFKTNNQTIYAKEGFLIVAFTWISVSLFGSLPFYISGEIPNFFDALFETISGFTTTGASILNDISSLSKSLLFWRSFTHWIGGMGVLVFIVALLGRTSDHSIHILRAEMTGTSVDKISPKSKDTAKILYYIYIALTIMLTLFLLFGEMSLFEALVHAFATAGTGGFGIKSDSIASYSHYSQWVIAIFMLIFGINFNLLYLFVAGKFISAFKNTEFITYFSIIVVAVILVFCNIFPLINNFSDCLRLSVFQVSSIISTTGFASANFDEWPTLSKSVLFILMFIGGCGGSTAGGFKVSRFVILFKHGISRLRQQLRPNSVEIVKLDGKCLDNETIKGVSSYLSIYCLLVIATFLLVSIFNNFSLETNLSATIACINNVGPGFDQINAINSYSCYNNFEKLVLSFAMLIGRLEIYPLLLLFIPSTYKKN